MPGGRLTQQDRRDIAAGLANGLGYAEIARRLSRPTSTVSREVSRNGGPGAYRAEQAHQATERRARRRRQTPRSAPLAANTAYGRNPEEMRDFAERLIETLVQTGVQRMASRVLACLYITDTGALTAKDLAQRLQVSPASISTAVAYLEEQELIRRDRDPRSRRELYSVDNALWYRSFLASAQRNFLLAETARDGARILGATTPAGARCEFVGEFLRRTGEDILQTAERWQHLLIQQARDNPE